jgi:hypothetical protein
MAHQRAVLPRYRQGALASAASPAARPRYRGRSPAAAVSPASQVTEPARDASDREGRLHRGTTVVVVRTTRPHALVVVHTKAVRDFLVMRLRLQQRSLHIFPARHSQEGSMQLRILCEWILLRRLRGRSKEVEPADYIRDSLAVITEEVAEGDRATCVLRGAEYPPRVFPGPCLPESPCRGRQSRGRGCATRRPCSLRARILRRDGGR